MTHHAYVYAGPKEEGIQGALAFVEAELGLSPQNNPDVTVFEYGHLSVDDARRITTFVAQAPVTGDKKAVIISAGRLFHEAQNALLKVFEEPSEGTTLILVIPAEGMLLPTLRSRLISLASEKINGTDSAPEFLQLPKAERAKFVEKLLVRTKADKDADKQAARLEVLALVEGITRAVYAARADKTGNTEELDLLLDELSRFLPILHERSAPLKLIFEHLLLVLPEKLGK
ncbi:hypothetical protein KJ848_03145 [Patescibacteria group bacterium]|nr:hypothetical protein [Patescibacteria group bacterium]MBU2159153.1 hypothetical protein [Patescibacteria group bacterium]